MTTINYIAIYILIGIIFASGFEYLKYRMNYKPETVNWERTFWITCWPYCVIMFFVGMFKK